MPVEEDCFISFQEKINRESLPQKFTFPFYYEPHPLCLLAAAELQEYLKTQKDWEHNFGIEAGKEGLIIGKMFGVLLVENAQKEIGYLVAFSGKLAGKNHHPKFVPPIFDMLQEDGFFRQEEEILNGFNRKIEVLESKPDFLECQEWVKAEEALAAERLAEEKQKVKEAKKERKLQRAISKDKLDASAYESLLEKLKLESIKSHFFIKSFSKYWKERLAECYEKLQSFLDPIEALKQERKAKSNALQQKLFNQYQFLNQGGEIKGLLQIFEQTAHKVPPAGSGECAAPKLLQYAFEHQMKPLAMAEFWWGQSPNSEIRKHGYFYPACRGKCEPILEHMLEGLELDENPMLTNPAIGKKIETVYEDETLVVVNKPAEFLSVPGKNIQDSVYLRMKLKYPNATGPLIVHRLDMSTSGLMLIAKTKDAHQYLQYQFLKKTIKKRYVALLNGIITADEGLIDLPLRVDLDNRPQQLVCYEHGKSARTEWKVIERTNQKTRIHFFPITGRTHQLRVHAAHPLGLNTPIIGDDLYGTRSNRLHLHAEYIEFRHPETKERMEIELPADF